MIIVELSVIPIGTSSPSVSCFVSAAVEKLKALGIEPQLTAMGTIFETKSMEKALQAVKAVHESVFKEGVQRVLTLVKIDERKDKESSIKQKVKSVEQSIE